MAAETPPVERSVTLEDVIASLDSEKVSEPFRRRVLSNLDRGYNIDRAEICCLADLTSYDVERLPGEQGRAGIQALLIIKFNQIPPIVASEGVGYLSV